MPPGALASPSSAADERQRLARIRELPADDEHEREADQQEEQAGEPVLETDDLVIGGEDVPAEHVLASYLRDWRDRKRTRPKARRDWCIFFALAWLADVRSDVVDPLSVEELKPMRFCSVSRRPAVVLRAGCGRARRAATAAAAGRTAPSTERGARGGSGDVAGRARPDADHRRRLPRLPHAEEAGTRTAPRPTWTACCPATPRATACRRRSSQSRAAPM